MYLLKKMYKSAFLMDPWSWSFCKWK